MAKQISNEPQSKETKNIAKQHMHKAGAVDEALNIAKESYGMVVDEETNRRLLRKVDFYICPLMCSIYAIQYMDKTSNSYAAIMGLREDLGMQGQMFSWTGTGFYLGYLFFEIPASLMLQRFPLAKTTAAFIILWGFVLCMSALPKNYAGFEALRVLLGALESGVTPAFVILTAQWYRAEEQFLRISIWFAFNGAGTILGALIAYGLYERENTVGTPIAAWRLLFLVIGVITIVLGIICGIHIPDIPSKAWFLTKEERLLVVERIRDNKQGFGNKHFQKDQLKEVFIDPRTYIMFFLSLAIMIPNGGLTNFGSIILSSLGYTNEKSLLMNAPQGAVEVVGLILGGLIAQWTQRRMMVGLATAACLFTTSTCLMAFAASPRAQLAGYYLFITYPIAFVCLLSCISSNTAGHTKKIVVQALSFVAYSVGNLIGPMTFVDSQAPQYNGAKITFVACSVICSLLISLLYYINWKENKRRDEAGITLDIENSEFADLTDFQNPEFRYAL